MQNYRREDIKNDFTNNFMNKERTPFAEEVRERKYFNRISFLINKLMASRGEKNKIDALLHRIKK